VDDITAVVIILLEGNPKDKSWGAAQKLMNNVDKFLERLRGYKGIIDQGQVGCRHEASCGTATTHHWHQRSRTHALSV
jgi:dynein heavy chain